MLTKPRMRDSEPGRSEVGAMIAASESGAVVDYEYDAALQRLIERS